MPTPPAAALRQAADMIKDAARRQQDAEPRHEDFYAIATASGHVLEALFAMNANVGAQLARYGEGRRPRTDVDGRGPAEVLDTAMSHSATLHATLTQAARAARNLAEECARLGILPEPEPAED